MLLKKFITNRYIVWSFVMIVLVIFVAMFYNSFIKNYVSETDSLVNGIIDKYNSGEEFIASFIDESSTLESAIDYYEDMYHLPVERINIKKASNKCIKRLIKTFKLQDGDFDVSLIIGRNNSFGIAVGKYNETSVKSLLKQYQFLTEDDLKYDVAIDDEPKQYFEKNENVLIYFNRVIDTKKYFQIRKYLYSKAKEENFVFYFSRSSMFASLEYYKFLSNSIDDIGSDILFIVNNNKMVDYIQDFNEEDVDKFLQKNGYID